MIPLFSISYLLQYLAIGFVPGKLPNPCFNLNYLSIRINFNDVDEVLTALCLLRSSPNLQELEVLGRPEEQTAEETVINFREDDQWSCHQLRLVKILGISGIKPELNFINLLLSTSPVLEKMTVKPASNNGGWELLKELLRFRRASVQAEIIYLDP
uniref:FBD domain-containing protein n=1 Tax=Fagus sylvatica TaxID=28930 RepID=A0A2N9FQE1_FAGSY